MKDYGFPLFVALWNRTQGMQTPSVHFAIAAFLENRWIAQDRRLLLMAFRSCGKSTLVGLFCVWLLWRNPDLRILVLSADLALARKMVRNVKRILEKHHLTRHLKPEHADQWGSDRFTVRRELELRDPSMLAKGITTNLTGTRADIIICDDVEVPKTSNNAEKREALRERLTELDYILTPDGMLLYVGTPHCFHTIYGHEPRRELGEDKIFLDGFIRMVVPVLKQDGESVWPERFTPEKIRSILYRTGPANFKSQMMCEPAQISEGYFQATQLLIYQGDIIYREASGEAVLSIEGRRMASVSVWWDPAFGREQDGKRRDRSVVAIVYTDEEGAYWLHHLSTIKVREGDGDEATQQCLQICELVKRFHFSSIRIETNGIGKFLPNILRKELASAGLACQVIEENSSRSKDQRILEALDAPLAARAIHVHASVLQTPFLREFEEWAPERKAGHDDCLDAVAGAISHAPVRIRRVYVDRRRAKWQGSSPQQAKSDFEV